MRLVAAVVVLAVIAAAPVRAQAVGPAALPDTGAVPRELVAALIGGFGSGAASPTITVGRLPAGFPANAVPSGAAVLGGVAASPVAGGMGRPTTVVLRVPLAPAEALAAVERQVAGAGWQPVSNLEPRGGFVPLTPVRPTSFCRDTASLNVWSSARPAGGAHVRLSFVSGGRYTACGRRGLADRPTAAFREDAGGPIPTLQAPPGAETLGGSAFGGVSLGRGSDASEASTRLAVTLAPPALVAHYAAQLRTAGWTLRGAPLAAAGMAAQAAEFRDSSGTRWQGLLTAVALPDTRERDVVFRVVRPVGTQLR